MQKIDKVVWQETIYIAKWVVLMSVLMQAVFLVIGYWDYTVLLGNVLGIAASVGNFLLMGITVQHAVTKEQDEAAKLVKLSQQGRHMLIILIALVAAVVPCFHLIAALIPLFFPGIAVRLRPLFDKNMK
jgi:carbon starvation protein CstA